MEWITINTDDELHLPGLLFIPEGETKTAVIFLHGNGSGSTFYAAGRHLPIAEELGKIGVAYLPFNNRGAHMVQRLTIGSDQDYRKAYYGSAHELIEECVKDIDAAVNFLLNRGYRTIYLAGHSSGANKACLYDFLQPNNALAGYLLLNCGDDSGTYYSQLGAAKFNHLLELSKEKIQAGEGRLHVPQKIMGEYVISYASLYDTINPEGPYNIFPFLAEATGNPRMRKKVFQEFSGITKPMLVVYAEHDQYSHAGGEYAVHTLKRYTDNPNAHFVVIPDTDHGFAGKEKQLAKEIGSWIKGQLAK